MTAVDVSTHEFRTPSPLPAPAPGRDRDLAVAGADAAVVRRIARTLAAARGGEGAYLYRPHPWTRQGLEVSAGRGVLDDALDTWLPGRCSVLSWWRTPQETLAWAGRLLSVVPPGGVWVGLGPLELPQARDLTARADAAGVRYLHAPAVADLSRLPEGERPAVLAYLRAGDDMPDWAAEALGHLASRVVWMGGLGPSGSAVT